MRACARAVGKSLRHSQANCLVSDLLRMRVYGAGVTSYATAAGRQATPAAVPGNLLPQLQSSLRSLRRGSRPAFTANSVWRKIPEIPDQTALYGLMAANVAIFVAWRGDTSFMLRHFTTSWDAVKAGRVHTLVLAAFSQRDTWHLASNMIGLYFFGRNAGWLLGGKGLVLLYLTAGTFGSMLYVGRQALQEQKQTQLPWGGRTSLTGRPSLGSSGAVNGIVIFEILMMPFSTVLIYGILPVPAWVLGGLFLFQDLNGALGHGNSNIGYIAHLGGAAVGAATYLGVRRGKIPLRWR